jgi:hypothetical protein
MAEELGEQGFIFAKGDDAVADVAGRKHVELFAQTAAGSAIVADGDHGTKIGDYGRARMAGEQFGRRESETLEAFEESGKAGAAADGHDAKAAVVIGILRVWIFRL